MPRLDPTMAADLLVFRVVADAGGFTAAAPVLGVTQGALSQRLARLEQRLGCRLFVRGRRLELTAEGARLVAAVRDGFDAIAAGLPAGAAPRLRVSCSASLALEWLGAQLASIRAELPGTEIELIAEDRALAAPGMAAEGIDLAIRYGPAAPARLDAVAVLEAPSLAVCAPGYRERIGTGGPILRLHDAAAWDGAAPTEEWDRFLAARPALGGRRFEDRFFNLVKLAWDAAAAGEGIAIGRRPVVDGYLAAGLLVPATDEAEVAIAAYHVRVAPGTPASAARDRFVAALGRAWRRVRPSA